MGLFSSHNTALAYSSTKTAPWDVPPESPSSVCARLLVLFTASQRPHHDGNYCATLPPPQAPPRVGVWAPVSTLEAQHPSYISYHGEGALGGSSLSLTSSHMYIHKCSPPSKTKNSHSGFLPRNCRNYTATPLRAPYLAFTQRGDNHAQGRPILQKWGYSWGGGGA